MTTFDDYPLHQIQSPQPPVSGPPTKLTELARTHRLERDSINAADLTGTCTVCGPTRIYEQGSYERKDGSIAKKYRCAGYVKAKRTRDRLRATGTEAPAPAPGRPRPLVPDVTVKSGTLTMQERVALTIMWAAEQNDRCALCGIVHPKRLGLVEVSSGYRYKGVFCVRCRELIQSTEGSLPLVRKLLAVLSHPDFNTDHPDIIPPAEDAPPLPGK